MKIELKPYQKLIIELYLLLIIISGSYIIGSLSGDWLQQKYIESSLKKDFIERDLKLIDKTLSYNNGWYSDKDFETYNWYFQTQYHYDLEKWSCRASALNWASYLDKHNIDYNYVYTSNHIFVIAQNEEGFCVLSNNITWCQGMSLN